ncbi:MAG: hypothetical protein FWC58_02050 [Desulfobulbus sp.]|nr:hypothetical protein [Desulfobulbus sp.]
MPVSKGRNESLPAISAQGVQRLAAPASMLFRFQISRGREGEARDSTVDRQAKPTKSSVDWEME